MFETLQSLITPAVMQRVTLLLNHVLSSETVATQRLKPHAGRRVRLTMADWPRALPEWPDTVFAITPAGLLEWQAPGEGLSNEAPADLTITVQASNPARMLLQALSGQKPRIDVAGDAALAADMSWLMDNLRWDIKDDLSRWIGQIPAHELGKLGQGIAQAMRDMAQRWFSGAKAGDAAAPTAAPPVPPRAP